MQPIWSHIIVRMFHFQIIVGTLLLSYFGRHFISILISSSDLLIFLDLNFFYKESFSVQGFNETPLKYSIKSQVLYSFILLLMLDW